MKPLLLLVLLGCRGFSIIAVDDGSESGHVLDALRVERNQSMGGWRD